MIQSDMFPLQQPGPERPREGTTAAVMNAFSCSSGTFVLQVWIPAVFFVTCCIVCLLLEFYILLNVRCQELPQHLLLHAGKPFPAC